MTEYVSLVREEVVATIDRAAFEHRDPDAISIEVTDSFQRRLGECRLLYSADSESSGDQYKIRIARRLFEDGSNDRWRDTVRHEIAHAYVLETVGQEVKPHGVEWKDAARQAGADPVARYEGADVVDTDYVLACPNGCFERGYLQRSKRIKTPWQYTCDECGTRPISYDIGERPADSKPGTCYVTSIPWQTEADRTTETTATGPLGTYSLVQTAVRPGRISNARSGSRTRGCTSVPNVRRHSSGHCLD